jgi:chemotaxis protein MotA
MKLDLSTMIGIGIGFGMIGIGMLLASGGDIGLMIALYVNQPSSFALTVGGSLGAVFMATPMEKLSSIFQVVSRFALTDQKNTAYDELIEQMVDFATEARRNGVLALDARTEEIEDPFIKNGIQLAVDGTAPEQIEEILSQEVDGMKKRHEENQGILLKWGEMAPAYGMIGTLIGLVAMLANMDDPSTIGPSMAIAIITTMYGSMVANMFCIPIANKLETRSKEEVTRKEMIIDSILAIQNGDNPRIVKQKLMTYIPPKIRETLATEESE